jgi:hypothetical protein
MEAASFCGRACEAVKDKVDSLTAGCNFDRCDGLQPPARPPEGTELSVAKSHKKKLPEDSFVIPPRIELGSKV